jgi:hypothetical protein
MTTSRTRAMTLLAVAFVVGVVVGGGALSMAVRAGKADWVWRSAGRPGGGRGGFGPQQRTPYGAYLDSTLRLGLDQVAKDSVTALYRAGMAQMDSINKGMWLKVDSAVQPFRAPLDSVRANTRAEIRSLIKADGQVRFDSLMKATDEQRRRRRDQGPGGGRGDGGGRGGPGSGPGSSSTGPGRGGSPGSGLPGGGGFDRGPF